MNIKRGIAVVIWMTFISAQAQIDISSVNELPDEAIWSLNQEKNDSYSVIDWNSSSLLELQENTQLPLMVCEQVIQFRNQFGPILNAQSLIHCGISSNWLNENFKRFSFNTSPTPLKKIIQSHLPGTSKIQITERPVNINLSQTLTNLPGIRVKYTYSLGQTIKFTLLGENDPGERLLDFISSNLELKNILGLEKAVIGHWNRQINAGFTEGRSTQFIHPLSIENSVFFSDGLSGQSSFNEDNGNWGIAADKKLSSLSCFGGIGFSEKDYRLTSNKSIGLYPIFGGFHQNNWQIQTKHALPMINSLLGLKKDFTWGTFETALIRHDFGLPILIPNKITATNSIAKSKMYADLSISLNQFMNARWTLNVCFEETTKSMALKMGALWTLSKSIDFTLFHIQAHPNFNSLNCNYRLIPYLGKQSIGLGVNYSPTKKLQCRFRLENLQNHWSIPKSFTENISRSLSVNYALSSGNSFDFILKHELGIFVTKTIQFEHEFSLNSLTKMSILGLYKSQDNLPVGNLAFALTSTKKMGKSCQFRMQCIWLNCPNLTLYMLDKMQFSNLGILPLSGKGRIINVGMKFPIVKKVVANLRLQLMQKINGESFTIWNQSPSMLCIFAQLNFHL